MSDPVQNFECLLKKQSSKQTLSLYKGNKQQNKHVYKPKDVISTVALQIKAIQVADSIGSEKCVPKNMENYKKSTFLCVNKLPVYEEVPKLSTKFDTQCVSDTQLINIIENAENIDVHRGMTQEFETSFCYHTEKQNIEDRDTNLDLYKHDEEKASLVNNEVDLDEKLHLDTQKVVSITKDIYLDTEKVSFNMESINSKESMDKIHEKMEIICDSLIVNSKENVEDINHSTSIISPIICGNVLKEISESNTQKNNIDEVEEFKMSMSSKGCMNKSSEHFAEISTDSLNNNKDINKSLSIISPIICGNNIRRKEKFEHSEYTQLEDCSQIFNEHEEIDDDTDMVIDRPLSPIFMHKYVKTKSETPSPLIFNLDKFEQFEKIAIPIVEANDLKTAKQVIDSQILDKELNLRMNEEIQLNQREIISPVFQNKNIRENGNPPLDDYIQFKSHIVNDPDTDTELEFIELDKATSNDLITKIMENNTERNIQSRADSALLKDEILFSSDEEEQYVHKSYEDLPFTCALETSFYNQSDVLDKTMYVGFQTASNKSIQVFTDSFAQAKSLLSNVATDEITVTDLVKNCDSVSNTKTQHVNEDTVKMYFNNDRTESNLAHGDGRDPELNTGIVLEPYEMQAETSSYEGFKTASKKEILLSDKALARCKKVFQDIDLCDDFNIKTEGDSLTNIKICEETIERANNEEVNKSSTDDDIQNFDDVIIKEFENIEMLLDENKAVNENNPPVEFKTASNKDIKISETALSKIKDVFQDINFDEELCEFEVNETDVEKKSPSVDDMKITPNLGNNNREEGGFKTASNKNINISKEALAKTKNIFQDIDSIQLPDKSNKIMKKVNEDSNNIELPKETFIGFKTANNKDIKISEQALAKTNNIFKDIDYNDFKFPKKTNKSSGENVNEDNFTDLPSNSFTGFKTASNRNINISKEAIAKTRKIFEDIDVAEMKLPKSIPNTKIQEKSNGFMDFNQPPTSYAGFGGFKTANNRNIKISDAAFTKTRNVFKDVDAADFKYPDKGDKDLKTPKQKCVTEKTNIINTFQDFNTPSTSISGFVGFKTANNKHINISKDSLAKTKNIFRDIDSTDYEIKTASNENTEKVNLITENCKERKTFSNLENKMTDFDQPLTSKGGCEKYMDLKDEQPQMAGFMGFKTANNKVIKVSKAALEKTRNVFKDVDSTKFQIKDKVKQDYPNIELNVKTTESNLVTHGAEDLKNLDTAIPKFQGFQTASNKQVKISADALLKSKKIFQNIDVNEELNIKSKEIEDKDGLDSPDNNKDGDKGIVDFNKDVDVDGKSGLVFKGFQTANKKPVTVSKEALARSRKLFEDIDFIPDDDHEPEFRGFKMSKDKNVEYSENATAETKNLCEDKVNYNRSFQGFQTASEKKVVVSEDALAKSRNIFKGIESYKEVENTPQKKPSDMKLGFKTGTNRDIVISEEGLTRSKRLFAEIDGGNTNHEHNNRDKVQEEIIADVIDTQVLNNFEESLNTEDFRETPVKSKRSGSPILSCPKAKRRKKFEIPYSQKISKPEIVDEIVTKNVKKNSFNENYKRNKQYTLKDLVILTKDTNSKIDPYLLHFNFENILKFEFMEERNDLSQTITNIDSLKQLFINSVNSKLIPNGWIDNHLRLIIWKLISYEIRFKSAIMCSAKNVIDQLKYRYDKELYNAQRPALRRILEKDDVASKTIVLCVAGVYVDGVSVASATSTNNLELLLTDGWYCIRATIDKMLALLVLQGKISVGTKIVTNGAELVNCEQGISPWEDTSAVRLKMFGNSTRRAKWDTRLGYHGNGAILSQLSSVKVDGGKVSRLRVYVTRVYPALYVEKFEDGSTVTRSERLEHLHQMKSEAERQAIMEKIYEEVEREFSDQESQDSEGHSDSSFKRTCLDSGSQIAKIMKRSKDPAEFRAGLTSSQSRLLEAHNSKHRERLLQDIQQKIRDKIEKAGVCVNRNVVTLLKIRVAGVSERSGGEVAKGMISIWKPTDAVLEIIKEGAWIDVMNVVPTAVRYSEIQLSAGRQSIFSISKYKETENIKSYTKLLKRKCIAIKDLAQNPSMKTDYNEIDTVGMMFEIDPSIQEFDSSKQPFQNVYLADADKNMICINFWGGIKKFGFQNVLDTGQIVACGNLQKRAGSTRKAISQYRVTEFSYFTKTPKNENARNAVDDLSKKFLNLDRRKFCEDCVLLKNNYSVAKTNNENISPYRFNTSEYNISRNKMFIDSPLARPNKMDEIFNLTGLDFESTFKQTDTQNLSEDLLFRKKKVNEKIAKLKMYGEPPPLSTIHIINKSKNASSSYKSPLNTNNNNCKNVTQTSRIDNRKLVASKSDSSVVNVASDKETPEKCANLVESDVVSSPVLNRTYVKAVNPVKLNFDIQQNNNDSNFDHFAEDFDGSPPLSLD